MFSFNKYNKYIYILAIHIPGQTTGPNGLKLFKETHGKPGGNMGKIKKNTLFPPYCLHNSSGNAGNFNQYYLDKFLVFFENI